MTYVTATRVGIAYLAVNALTLGVWAVLAPQSFYDNFPGFGRTWISLDGPYNEHLIRDVGALNLALLSLLIAAGYIVNRQVVTIAAIASLAWSLPHLIYHLFNTEALSAGDNAASLGGLALACAFPVMLLYLAPRLE